ncbi:hypothetical protein C8R44DRAFT_896094 [Mycena epipterygia]|nr:hypothetical protein C8R44DRAFT_896094 [Mycena epipterygia]
MRSHPVRIVLSLRRTRSIPSPGRAWSSIRICAHTARRSILLTRLPSPTLAPGLAVRMVTVRVARIYAPLIGHAPLFPGHGSSRPDPALTLPFPVSATLLRSFRPERQCYCSQDVRCVLWAAGVHAAHRPHGVSFPVPATILRAAPDSSTRAAAPKTFAARCRRSGAARRTRGLIPRAPHNPPLLLIRALVILQPGHSLCAPRA